MEFMSMAVPVIIFRVAILLLVPPLQGSMVLTLAAAAAVITAVAAAPETVIPVVIAEVAEVRVPLVRRAHRFGLLKKEVDQAAVVAVRVATLRAAALTAAVQAPAIRVLLVLPGLLLPVQQIVRLGFNNFMYR